MQMHFEKSTTSAGDNVRIREILIGINGYVGVFLLIVVLTPIFSCALHPKPVDFAPDCKSTGRFTILTIGPRWVAFVGTSF